MSSQSYGTPGMIPQPARYIYRQGQGWTSIKTWKGQKKASYGLAHQLVSAGYDVELSEEGPCATVTATLSANTGSTGVEVPVNLWELTFNQIEKSIYEYTAISQLKNVVVNGKDLLSVLRTAIENKTARADIDEDIGNATFFTAYDLIMSGVESFVVNQAVVRHTQTVSGGYDREDFLFANCGKILTDTQLSRDEGAPAAVIREYDDPEDFGFSIITGYKKGHPSLQQTAGNRWQAVTEYVFGVWPRLIFTRAS